MMKTFKPLTLLLLAVNLLVAQNENNNWFFGQNCGLSFSPTATATTGSLNTFEGCASISDNAGNLLFYTDGISVYDRNGLLMTNGSGLLGNPSSTSSAIIVPRPCSKTEYYIFAVDFVNGSNGVTYSLVDMDDNGDCFVSSSETGQVVLTTKNVSLPGPTGERICALKKNNGLDYWVIATQMNTNNFYVYEVTALGVNPIPSVQSIGSILSAGYYLKGSPDGTKIGLTDGNSQSVFLYDFDNTLGQITNQVLVGTAPIRPYGLEFSPNSQKLYYSDFANGNGSGTGRIFEVDIFPILGSPVQIATIANQGGRYACGALQLTPENPPRILIAKDGENSLAAINNPDVGGASNFLSTAVNLTNVCYLGLPTFISGSVERCKPLDMFNYRPAVPDLFSNLIKTEIMTDRFMGIDKEYDDLDNDGDTDILFTKNNTLHYFENTGGYCNPPNYPNPSISLNINNCYSFRLYDWDNDGDKDLIIHGTQGGSNGVFLFTNNGTGIFPGVPSQTLLVAPADFPFEPQQLIEVGDLNHDNFPDLLISGQGAIYGTAYFENVSGSLTLVGGQTFQNPFIPEDNGSYPCPELYDADCANGIDILLSDPLTGPNSPSNPTTFFGGGRMVFYENLGNLTSGTTPNFSSTGLINQFGFNDLNNNDLRCDWVITRIVDFFNDNCPIATSYNPCNEEIYFYYQQNCDCSSQNFLISTEDLQHEESLIKVFPNPSDELINIATEAGTFIQSYRIYSADGKLVKTGKYTDPEINVGELNSGIYFLILQTSKGEMSKKIVIQ